MCGKDMWCGGWKGQAKVLFTLLLKLTLLPALMIGLTQLCNLRGDYGLALVLLSCCPLAPLAFLVCQQYGFGAELSTSITIQGVLLMLPQMMAVIKIAQAARLYDVPMLAN
jgi:predicted permease